LIKKRTLPDQDAKLRMLELITNGIKCSSVR